MELFLCRNYYPNGTNGQLYINEVFLCYTIELPWLNNQPKRSCIPEGRYTIEKRWSPHFGDHYQLKNVPGRDLILIHPANNALKELKGCIAPVSYLVGEGKGSFSRLALKNFSLIVDDAMKEETVYLTIAPSPFPVKNHS